MVCRWDREALITVVSEQMVTMGNGESLYLFRISYNDFAVDKQVAVSLTFQTWLASELFGNPCSLSMHPGSTYHDGGDSVWVHASDSTFKQSSQEQLYPQRKRP